MLFAKEKHLTNMNREPKPAWKVLRANALKLMIVVSELSQCQLLPDAVGGFRFALTGGGVELIGNNEGQTVNYLNG
jgi:hypothetical protein